MNLFNDIVVTALKKQLDASSLRQRVTANNLSNINTPGFKKSTVSFEEKLADALKANAARQARTAYGNRNVSTTHSTKSERGTGVNNTSVPETGGARNNKTAQTANGNAALDRVQPRVMCDRWTAVRADGNNVDLEEEMVVLASNGFMYQTASQLISSKYSDLSYVIKGGR